MKKCDIPVAAGKRSLAVYWSVLTAPPATQDALYDPNSLLNRDDGMRVHRIMREYIEELGGECHTLDVFQEQNIKPDVVVFLEVPQVPLEMILGEWTDKVIKYVILFECQVVLPRNWDSKMYNLFDKVFTWNDDLVDNEKFFKINFSTNFPEAINQDISKKKHFCTLIAGNKLKGHPLELYSKRIEAIRWFECYHPEDFDLYGIGWNIQEYPSYKGSVKTKKEILEMYRFAICYENAQQITGYITEKILDCFAAGCIPVYWGASNITQYIPSECFLDRREFSSYEALYQYMKNMSDEDYKGYLRNIQKFLTSKEIVPFTMEYLPQQIVKQWRLDCNTTLLPKQLPQRNLSIHYWHHIALDKRLQQKHDEAYEAILKAYEEGKAAKVDFSKYMFVFTEMAFILDAMGKDEQVIEVCQYALHVSSKPYIDIYFLLSQKYLQLGNLQEGLVYCEKYLALFDQFTEAEKDAYTTDYSLPYYKEMIAILVKLYIHLEMDQKALELFPRVEGITHIQEILAPMYTLYARNHKEQEFAQHYTNHLIYMYPVIAEQYAVLTATSPKRWQEEGNSRPEEKQNKSLTNDLVCQLEHMVQKGYLADALAIIDEYQSIQPLCLEMLVLKALIYRKQFGLDIPQ